MDEYLKPWTYEDLCKMHPYPRPEPQFRHWKWHPDNQTLELAVEGEWYEVDFENMQTSAQCLDWIFQCYGKDWPHHAEVMLELLRAIEWKIEPQQRLCSFGIERGRDAKG